MYFFVDSSHDYVKNDLYVLLSSTIEGRIILGTYAHSKVLDYSALADIIIFDELINDQINYR